MMRVGVVSACMFCACFSARADSVDEIATAVAAFETAVSAYDAGDFSEAHTGFTSVAESYLSVEVCSNAGSAAYRLGKNGEAVLWFRRALALNSQSVEARQNLRFLKRRLGFLQFDSGALGQYGGVFRTAVWRFWFACFAGTSAICLVAAVFLRLSVAAKGRLIWVLIVAAILSLVAGIGWWANSSERPILSIHVVVEADATALTAPNNSAGRVVLLPPGSEVAYLERRGAWVYAEIPSGSRGWIRA